MIRITLLLLALFGCSSVEPTNIEIQDRLRPPYNYALMKNIDSNTMDYEWSEDDSGYYRTGKEFYDMYIKTMLETNDMSHKNAYKIYKTQKVNIATKYKTDGRSILASKEEEAINTFLPSSLNDSSEIIITDEDEFAITKDITIEVQHPQ